MESVVSWIKDTAEGVVPIYSGLVCAADREPSSVVSKCVLRWSESELEREGVCVLVLGGL